MTLVLSDERAIELIDQNAKLMKDSVNSPTGFAGAHLALGKLMFASIFDPKLR